MFYLDHRSSIPIYLQLQTQVNQAINGGVLKEGDQLPSVRELATQLTVNPNTIARAYQELEREGVIETLRGRGTFIAKPQPAQPHEERYERIKEAINHLVMEAYRLGLTQEELRKLVKEQLDTEEGDRQ